MYLLEEEFDDERIDLERQLAAARSWVNKMIKDVDEERYGLVRDVTVREGVVRLVVRFQGEQEDRLVALEFVPDGHYMLPTDARARYRPLARADRELLRKLAQSKNR
jgi:S-adenosylmethionine synthetase